MLLHGKNQLPETTRDQYFYIADQLGQRILGDRFLPASNVEIEPLHTDGLVVISQYQGTTKGWQHLDWAKFYVPEEGIVEQVSSETNPNLYDNVFSEYTLGMLRGFLNYPDCVRMQSFAGSIPGQNGSPNVVDAYVFNDKRRPDAAAVVRAELGIHSFPGN